eukprot:8870977-Karenia_brevis.AAC.1
MLCTHGSPTHWLTTLEDQRWTSCELYSYRTSLTAWHLQHHTFTHTCHTLYMSDICCSRCVSVYHVFLNLSDCLAKSGMPPHPGPDSQCVIDETSIPKFDFKDVCQ